MHEFSIARALVEIVSEHTAQASGEQVLQINLRIGALACIHSESLRFGFKAIVQGTNLEEAELNIAELPVVIYCSRCQVDQPLPGIQSLLCPTCGTPSGDVRQGNELDLESIEFVGASESDRPTSVVAEQLPGKAHV